MSVVISYTSSNVAIIITDTRISFGKNQEYGYSDDNEKLYDLKYMGWSAGTGLAEFLDPFKSRLSMLRITNTDEIVDIYTKTIEEAMIKYPELCEDIKTSNVIFSWIGYPDKNIYPCCNTGLMSMKHFGTNIAKADYEKFCILFPYEYDLDSSIKKDFEKKYSYKYSFDGDLNEVIRIMLNMFEEISNNAMSVSNICDIGIIFKDAENIIKLRIKDDVNELLLSIENCDLSSKIISYENW